MGVGGNFWDALKPYARYEGFDFLRDKKVAVDLSFWIVQHEAALKSSYVRNPHIRITFFRTINLFSKFGAFPVFVVDGKPSPLKSQARIARFIRFSGIDTSDSPVAKEGISADRNKYFVKCVEECVELLKLLGMPILRARGEAEALCAQLNSEGLVDACITADSDAFLFGAKCVIKHLNPKSKGPFECYHVSEIETAMGLRRKHFIAISLLVGSDHNLNGVQGVGLDTALRFVKNFSEDQVLDRLHEIGSGAIPPFHGNSVSPSKYTRNADKDLKKLKDRHCSLCGHLGSKTAHSKVPCEPCYSINGVNCYKKAPGFKCACSGCEREREEREYKKNENWHIRVCNKIAAECNFPINEIIEIYMGNEDSDVFRPLSWKSPDIELLIDFLAYYQNWEPSYVRQRMFPMLSTIFLRERAANSSENLLHGQYEFDSIQRLKVRYGHEFYEVKWRNSSSVMRSVNDPASSEVSNILSTPQPEEIQTDLSTSGLDELDMPQICIDDGGSFILTDENLILVQKAFPEKVNSFLKQKEIKESKRRKSTSLRSGGTCEKSPTPNSGVQLAITDYYRSSKRLKVEKDEEDFARNSETGLAKEKSKGSSATLSKSVRRRLLFG